MASNDGLRCALRHRIRIVERLEDRRVMSADPFASVLGGPIDHDALTDAIQFVQYGDSSTDSSLVSSRETGQEQLVGATLQALSSVHDLTGLTQVRNTYGLRGAGQTVAIIDCGVAYDHSALGGGLGDGFRVVGGWDYAENDSDPYDDSPEGAHGTHVAGIVGAADGDPATGVAPDASFVALRVFDDNGAGSFDWIGNAIEWVLQNQYSFEYPITTVNFSLGTDWNSDVLPPSAPLEAGLAQLEASGIFIAAAAGNEFATNSVPGLSYPAVSPHVVPVMSVDDTGQLSFFSQRHSRAIAAPGRLIRSTVPDYAGNNNGVTDDFGVMSGTNMAAPYIAGASMLIREAMEVAGYVDITQQTIYDHMMSTADSIIDPATNQNYSRLNLLAAIDAIMPEDDYGSTAETALDLGAIGPSMQIAGLIGTIDDVDFFRFSSAATGMASVSTTPFDYLAPHWIVEDEFGQVILESSAGAVDFPVDAGRSYTIGLSTSDGIGRFEGIISVDTLLVGDFNRDGAVSGADYTVWRNTLGQTGLTPYSGADGDGDGDITVADYAVWKANYGNPPPAAALTVGGMSSSNVEANAIRPEIAARTEYALSEHDMGRTTNSVDGFIHATHYANSAMGVARRFPYRPVESAAAVNESPLQALIASRLTGKRSGDHSALIVDGQSSRQAETERDEAFLDWQGAHGALHPLFSFGQKRGHSIISAD